MRISDWSSDVCSSDLFCSRVRRIAAAETTEGRTTLLATFDELCNLYGSISDAKTGQPLFSHTDTFARIRQIRKRIAMGCMSDDSDLDLNIPLTSDEIGRANV